MKLYLVKSALPFFVSKQDEAKREARTLRCSWEAVEVPTTEGREALAAFLNTLGGPASVQILADEGNDDHVPVLPPTAQDEQDEVLSSTTFSDVGEAHREAERARLKGVSLEVDAITERIGELDGWPLGSVVQAATSRMLELAKQQELLK